MTDNAPFDFTEALKHTNIAELNEMQKNVLNSAKNEHEIVLLSPTGSGKTLAFLLSILSKLDVKNRHLQTIILCPTRELALQTEQVFKSFKSGFKVSACYGGHSITVEEKSLSEMPAVLIGTPGRIGDHVRRGNIFLSTVRHLIIDEFDKCLEFGFKTEMETLIENCRNLEFTILTSATDISEIPEFMNLKNPLKLDYSDLASELQLNYFKLNTNNDRLNTTLELIKSFQGELSILFCNFREQANDLSEAFRMENFEHSLYHGGLEQDERERALLRFRNGSSNLLVCTDIGARGLDIPEIKNVVHYQLPQDEDSWIHRNGRTARMSADGNVFAYSDDFKHVKYSLNADFLKHELQKSEDWKKPEWITLYISAGKKNKLSKGDIVGFLIKTGSLENNEIGRIDVMDFQSFVSIPAKKVKILITNIEGQKLKGKKQKIEIAR